MDLDRKRVGIDSETALEHGIAIMPEFDLRLLNALSDQDNKEMSILPATYALPDQDVEWSSLDDE